MGDDAAFAELYDAIAPRLLGFLRKATRHGGAAKDRIQQTLRAHRADEALGVVLRAAGEAS